MDREAMQTLDTRFKIPYLTVNPGPFVVHFELTARVLEHTHTRGSLIAGFFCQRNAKIHHDANIHLDEASNGTFYKERFDIIKLSHACNAKRRVDDMHAWQHSSIYHQSMLTIHRHKQVQEVSTRRNLTILAHAAFSLRWLQL